MLTGVEHVFDIGALGDETFDEMHISRRLVHAAATDDIARRVVSELVRLAHDRSVLVGAAGVDRPEHGSLVVELGLDLASGDLYGGPEPANSID